MRHLARARLETLHAQSFHAQSFRARPVAATAALLAALAIVVVGCAADGPIVIGGVVPRSGPASLYGESVERGMVLAIDELRAAHQRGEFPLALALELRDSGSDPEQAAAALEELFDAGARAAVGGVTAAETHAMAAVADREKRVVVSPTARGGASAPSESAESAGASRYVFRLFPSLDREGSKLASFAALELRLRRSAVVAPTGDGAAGDSFTQEFERNRGEVVSRISYGDPATDGERIVKEVLASRPQAVLVSGPGEPVAEIVAGLQSRGYRGALLTTSSFAAPKVVAAAGRHAEGVLLARPTYDSASRRPAVRAFVAAFEKRHGETPDLWAAYGYDAVRVLAAAMVKAPSPRDAWVGLRGLTEYEGVTGHIQFDEAGDIAAFPRVYVVSKGKMKELAEMEGAERRRIINRLASAASPDRTPVRLPS